MRGSFACAPQVCLRCGAAVDAIMATLPPWAPKVAELPEDIRACVEGFLRGQRMRQTVSERMKASLAQAKAAGQNVKIR